MSFRKRQDLIFYANGHKIVESAADPEWTLLYYLRSHLKLSGPKLGCGEGGCGACTVMISRCMRETGKIKHYSAYACLTPLVALHGLSVITVEGLGSTRTRLHPVQQRIALSHGSQCGFCTPGFVMSMYALLRNSAQPSIKEIEDNLIGNLCRCTGYRPIIEGFSTFSRDCGKENCCQIKNENCCQNKKENCCQSKKKIESEKHCSLQAIGCGKENCCQIAEKKKDTPFSESLFDSSNLLPYDSSQEIIFPPSLRIDSLIDKEELEFRGPRLTWFRPTSMERLVKLSLEYPSAKIIAGNTEIGIDVKYKNKIYEVLISSSGVPELNSILEADGTLNIGASVTLSDLEEKLRNMVKELPEPKTRVFTAILEMLEWFGSKQIKNVATMGGGCMNASPISDLNPILVAAGATLIFWSEAGEKRIKVKEFLTNKNQTSKTDLLSHISIPHSNENEYLQSFKQSRRRTDDIAIVNAAMQVEFEPKTSLVKSICLVFGGMDAKTKLAVETNQALIGLNWNEELLEKGISKLGEEFRLGQSAPGGMVQYRQTLVLSFFLKFFLNIKATINGSSSSEIIPFHRPNLRASQVFEKRTKTQSETDSIGKPLVHTSGLKHATGEATFVDDLPKFEDELHAALVVSSVASGKITTIDTEDALQMEGVQGFYSAKDLDGERNATGVLVEDEEVFASEEVKFVGHVIGVIVGDTRAIAREAAKRVRIYYEEKPPILTIEDAIGAHSLWDPLTFESGNVSEGFRDSPNILEGEIRIGGQEHFYLETQTSVVLPNSDGEITIFSATQNPSETQRNVAKALGADLHRVVCKVRRIGGGFGGKEIMPGRIATYAAVAAHNLQRPVRIVLERDEDMAITGGRHPMKASWKVGFTNDGTLKALTLSMHANAGYSLDISPAMATKAILHADNVYRIPNTQITCTFYQTNLASNTAMRGTGAPQSMLIMEDIMTRISSCLRKEPHEVRAINLYVGENPTTHYGQQLDHCTIRRCWEEVIETAQFHSRLQQVKKFNEANQYSKRGICAIPCKMAISFGLRVLEQAGALGHLYQDGSVLLSHGGVEMGQGLNTKMIQIASRELGIATDKIYISETATDKVPNASSTAASCSSDLNGMAVKEACQKLMQRLEPYRSDQPEGDWVSWITAAYNDRVSLSATGFFKTPGLLDFDFAKQAGSPYNYFTYGAAVSEVEIDTLTGDHKVLRTDIVMDVGESLNPAIDIGQIEGAFTLGYGMYCLEEHLYTKEGKLITAGPSNYKIPSVLDIPCEFNISLLRNSSNPRAIYSSRGIGEPPMFLASSVFFAIKEAVRATLDDQGPFRLDSPATAERIRMSCRERFDREVVLRLEDDSKEPWCIRV